MYVFNIMTHDEYTLKLAWTIEYKKFELYRLLDRDGNPLNIVDKIIGLVLLK